MADRKVIEPRDSLADFLKTDSGKTKSNAIEVPSISLPKGGGAIKGIDEKFSVNAVNGTASFSISLPVAASRGVVPSLNLSYNSGNGNSVFGLGWNLDIASIRRKTSTGLPQYMDASDSDTYLFSEAEDLVPEFKKNETSGLFITDDKGAYEINKKDSPDGLFSIQYYRPRIESMFARIERWSHKTNGEIKWRVITKENTTTLFGWSSGSRITDPQDGKKTFAWLPEFVFDDKGNCSEYIYKKENETGFDPSRLHNKNRRANGAITYTNLYLEKVLYGNKTPYRNFGDGFPAETDYLFQTIFDYGSLNNNDPPEKINNWDFRTDAFSDYKSGFEIRTTRRCKRVLLFHYFTQPGEYSGLVKSLNFEYDATTQKDFTFLRSVTSYGYINTDGTYSVKKLPSIEFQYQQHEWNASVKNISSDSLAQAPAGLDEPQYQFTDLYNEGLAGILTEQAAGWYYKSNLGEGNFEPANLVSPKPSFAGLGDQLRLMDLDADGGKQLVSYSTMPKGYFELNDEDEWQNFKDFTGLPNIDLNDPNTKMIDLNGDGRADILIADEHIFTWYGSAGRDGFTDLKRTLKPFDEEAGPHMIFADGAQNIFLADMSGDGLSDIVRIRNGEICYWPNLGYGKFGAKVAMDNSPLFDRPDIFDPSYIRLADIDGSGTTDIVYLGKNKFSCWTNLSGNSFNTVPFEITAFPEINSQTKINVIDLLGNGIACIVWSSHLPDDSKAPLRYIDLMNSKKPHIMMGYKNNMGREVSITYKASTRFYIQDKLNGRPWITKLHFPVHCVSKTETRDRISGYRFVSEFKYRHGYYDHAEKEFRGFGMVEQTDAEQFEDWIKGNAGNIVDRELRQEPVVSKTWTHTGASQSRERILLQFAGEYWYEEMQKQGFVASHTETALPDAIFIPGPALTSGVNYHLTAEEQREAFRACKGMKLRSEVFARDAIRYGNTDVARKTELTPFSVASLNCAIQLLQPRGPNRHAVFVVKESEAITYSYERNPADPHIAHNLNIKLDEYGNVLQTASVVYPRKIVDASLPAATQKAQGETLITYTENTFTNDIDVRLDPVNPDVYRLRLPSETLTYQLKGVKKNTTASPFYSLSDFDDILEKSEEALYHELDKDPDDTVAPANYKPVKRLIEQVRTLYRNDNLADPLPLGFMGSLGFTHETYQLAYTKDLLHEIYSARKQDDELVVLMKEGKFVSTDADTKWWIASGSVNLIDIADPAVNTPAKARDRFYAPVSYADPYGSVTRVKYDRYFLFVEETTDALANQTSITKFNYRTLSPRQMKDANDNLSEAITDELGLVKAIAVMGKDLDGDGTGDEADNLTGLSESTNDQDDINAFFAIANATGICQSDDLKTQANELLKNSSTRFIYDFETFRNTGRPVVVAAVSREQHFSIDPESPVQISFDYTNGLGQVIMKKAQAEPGIARQVSIDANGSATISDTDTITSLRWTGNGRTILNNKGNVVKQYEAFFSVSPRFEEEKELFETGVTPLMYYDAMSRLIKTDMPDGSFSKVAFDSWRLTAHDANDTVKESIWYKRRTDPARPDYINDVNEQAAAVKSAAHYDTPLAFHLDTLGRPALQVENNGKDAAGNDILYKTKRELDIEGNLIKVIDARELTANAGKGNTVMEYRYDMLGNKVYQKSMDAGKRWLLLDIAGNPLRTWDERNHEFQYFYDILHRPVTSIVRGGDMPGLTLDHIINRIFYGENEINDKQKNLRGKPIRHFDTAGLIETPAYDFKGQPLYTTRKHFSKYKEVANWTDANLQNDLENEAFTFITETDALGRITKQTAPDESIFIPSYNEAGLLDKQTVTHVNPAASTTYIKKIDYDEKGQRAKIIYGNNVSSTFYYDKETFRLRRLETKKQNGNILQDLYYVYDPVGNITSIKDNAYDPEFFSNQIINAVNNYAYDALYRITEATGRENAAALNFGASDNWSDAPYMQSNPMAVASYTQRYKYDEAGNILEINHMNKWVRTFEYEVDNNRLKNTRIGQGPNSFTYLYPHQPVHGFITSMPHLEEMGWNFNEELIKTVRQKINPANGTAETTWYQYDGQGQRIRKITENSANAGAVPTKKEERIYISGYEAYKKYSGTNAGLIRSTISLLDQEHRFASIETRNDIDDGTAKRLARYQLPNHLGSAVIELDNTDRVISYEEYYPYGNTCYQIKNNAIKCAAKQYRYTGMERDEETGMEYHKARYYLPWLGRWLNCDPIRISGGINVYQYVSNNPIAKNDLDGREEKRFDKMTPEERMKMNVPRVFMDEQRRETSDPTPAVPEWKTRPYVEPTEVRLVKAGVTLLIGGILAIPTGGSSVLGAIAVTGGLSSGIAVTMSGVSLGIAKDVAPVSARDEKNLEMAALTAPSFVNPVGMFTATAGAISTGTLEGTYKWGETGSAVWNAGEGLYSLGKIGFQETKFQMAYEARSTTANFAWNKTLKEEIRNVLTGKPNAAVRANPLFYGGKEYTDLSHFIPQRAIEKFNLEKLLNRPINVTPRWATEHAMVDPGRFKWMTDEFKDVYGASKSLPERIIGDAPPWLVGTSASYYSLMAQKYRIPQNQSRNPD